MIESSVKAESKADRHAASSPRRWRRMAGIGAVVIFVLSCGFLLAEGGSADSNRLTGKGAYVASTALRVSLHPAGILIDTARQEPSDALAVETIRKTQAALVKSHFVLNRALSRPGVADLAIVKDERDPIEWLEQNLQVDFRESPEIMRISLPGDRPADLVTLLQAVSDVYLEESVSDELESRYKRLQKLKDLATKYEQISSEKRRALQALAARAAGHATFASEVNEQILSDLKKEISRSRIARLEEQAKLNRLAIPKIADARVKEKRTNLEEAIALLTEKERLFAENGTKVFEELKRDSLDAFDLEGLRQELRQIEEVANKLRREVEMLNIELTAPPRVQRRQGEIPNVKKR